MYSIRQVPVCCGYMQNKKRTRTALGRDCGHSLTFSACSVRTVEFPLNIVYIYIVCVRSYTASVTTRVKMTYVGI